MNESRPLHKLSVTMLVFGTSHRRPPERLSHVNHLKLGDSYAAAVQGLCNDQADIGWYGPVTFGQAHEMCGAELLAVDVKKGNAVYYSGIYARKDAGLKSLKDLKGKSLAVGDPNSTSSFNFPMAMVMAAGIDPARDL